MGEADERYFFYVHIESSLFFVSLKKAHQTRLIRLPMFCGIKQCKCNQMYGNFEGFSLNSALFGLLM